MGWRFCEMQMPRCVALILIHIGSGGRKDHRCFWPQSHRKCIANAELFVVAAWRLVSSRRARNACRRVFRHAQMMPVWLMSVRRLGWQLVPDVTDLVCSEN